MTARFVVQWVGWLIGVESNEKVRWSGGQDGDYKEERLLGFCSVESEVLFFLL